MRPIHTLLLVSLLCASPCFAQSLDIGGIELTPGQQVDDALKRLGAYRVTYDEHSKSWLVAQLVDGRSQALGRLAAASGRIAVIMKFFRIPSDGETVETYSAASSELRRLGGKACTTREVQYQDRLIRDFETKCGRYSLAYTLPWASSGGTVSASITMTLMSP